MSTMIYKIVVLGEGTFSLNQVESAKHPYLSNTSMISLMKPNKRLSTQAIYKKKWSSMTIKLLSFAYG